ncbi:nucleophile aminohydrolase [Coniochaeta sp. 2T2.1]|nr:nucleophile aminohydrolase [Coniochaeta sp. 2T2.1]
MDGSLGLGLRRSSVRRPVAAIFIHAGAGYHSTTNEKIHLQACNDAAQVAMRFLKAGADATVAVEQAIKCLEDKEITNAGIGSNLSIDGIVEGDATIVDHLGRSGGCGAVAGIKNPITLAKIILDASSQKLSLRRVPPNILVGLGAQLFAKEQGMEIFDNEKLVSGAAQERFEHWFEDLEKAEAKIAAAQNSICQYQTEQRALTPANEYKAPSVPIKRDHQAAILNATWNEGQPDSPYNSTPTSETSQPPSGSATPKLTPSQAPLRSPYNFMPALKRPRTESASSSSFNLSASLPAVPASKRTRPTEVSAHDSHGSDDQDPDTAPNGVDTAPAGEPTRFNPFAAPAIHPVTNEPTILIPMEALPRFIDHKRRQPTNLCLPDAEPVDFSYAAHAREDRDLITDTVGAIAIDLRGRIAAGSSSGGIGMKHRGRVGPAALVGVGTAVIPTDPEDEDVVSVAAITSGTGEHMATTMASHKCAERLYHSTRRGRGGRDVAEDDEDAVMESFVTHDFMGHPGVRNQPSAGAIGVMAVKKSRHGYYFYFAHNTDSFALASMSSAERAPVCVMSRTPEANVVTRGGRKIRTP